MRAKSDRGCFFFIGLEELRVTSGPLVFANATPNIINKILSGCILLKVVVACDYTLKRRYGNRMTGWLIETQQVL